MLQAKNSNPNVTTSYFSSSPTFSSELILVLSSEKVPISVASEIALRFKLGFDESHGHHTRGAGLDTGGASEQGGGGCRVAT